MPLAGGISRCRVLYWPRHLTANSPPMVSNGLNTVGQCWLSQNQNFASSCSLSLSWKTRLYGYSFSQPSAPAGPAARRAWGRTSSVLCGRHASSWVGVRVAALDSAAVMRTR